MGAGPRPCGGGGAAAGGPRAPWRSSGAGTGTGLPRGQWCRLCAPGARLVELEGSCEEAQEVHLRAPRSRCARALKPAGAGWGGAWGDPDLAPIFPNEHPEAPGPGHGVKNHSCGEALVTSCCRLRRWKVETRALGGRAHFLFLKSPGRSAMEKWAHGGFRVRPCPSDSGDHVCLWLKANMAPSAVSTTKAGRAGFP